MTHIEIFGPHRDLVPEWTDPDTGEVVAEHWEVWTCAEALGADGLVYMKSSALGEDSAALPGVQATHEHMLRYILEHDMKDKGVWAE